MSGEPRDLPRVFLVRHGETEWNAIDRLVSHTDLPLNARGEAQARRLGAELAADGIRFDRALASPLVRARRTAELVLEALPDPPALELDGRLVEVDFGPLEGWTSDEVAADAAAMAWRRGSDHPGVETTTATIERVRAAWDSLPLEGTTLVVGHARFLRFLICACVLGMQGRRSAAAADAQTAVPPSWSRGPDPC